MREFIPVPMMVMNEEELGREVEHLHFIIFVFPEIITLTLIVVFVIPIVAL
jgi:hypothetical protein